MKKVERINVVIMLYINNQIHFTISGIKKKFNNSPWAAFRVIREIKITGIPHFMLLDPSIPKHSFCKSLSMWISRIN